MTDKTKKTAPKKLPKYLNKEEMLLLLETPYKTKKHHIIMMKLMGKSGLRVSEVAKVLVKHFQFDPVKPTVTVRGGKGDIDRVVPIDHPLSNEIQEYIALHKLEYEDNLFDVNARGIRGFVKRYGIRAGLKHNVHPHMLRHSYAVNGLKAGMSLRTIQKMLGHKSLTTTQIYLDITIEDVVDDYLAHPLGY